jgi:hypothetical protein
MTEEQIALSRRAVACKGWKWLPGMADHWGRRLREGDWLDPAAAFPDFTDAATLGCLLALVREALKSEDRLWGGRVEVHQDSHCLFVVVSPEHDPNGFLYHRWISSGASEVESLVAALEAAP